MELNEHSHVHKKIHQLCQQLELLADMKLVTDFKNFEEIRFLGKFGYITIDFNRIACYTLGIKLNEIQMNIVQDIILYCRWLNTANTIELRKKQKNRANM